MKARVLKKSQISLGSRLAHYHVCEFCDHVYQDPGQTRVGMPCKVCDEPNTQGGRNYYGSSVWSLINLMEEFYHKDSDKEPPPHEGINDQANAPLAVVLFFASLREVLIKHLLTQLMIKQRLTSAVAERLFSDNQSVSQMLQKLFPAVAGGLTWREALKEAQPLLEYDVFEIDDFLRTTAAARNRFLHDGTKWSITPELAEQCMLYLENLLDIFVTLHNVLVPEKPSDSLSVPTSSLQIHCGGGHSGPFPQTLTSGTGMNSIASRKETTMPLNTDTMEPTEILLLYVALKAFFDSPKAGHAFHNCDLGHPFYTSGADGGETPFSNDPTADGPDKNHLYIWLSALSIWIKDNTEPSTAIGKDWYDFSSWESFCKYAVAHHEQNRE